MVSINTSIPTSLLAKFKAAIDNGKITTWKYYSDGDFTHTPTQWADLAYMRPVTSNGVLSFNIVKTASKNVTVSVYGVYHGRLVEAFLNHFDSDFTLASSSAKPLSGDVVA